MIKIEFDVPDFEKELNINVTLKRDGEVIFSSPSTSEKMKSVKEKKVEKKVTPPTTTIGGNMMNLDI